MYFLFLLGSCFISFFQVQICYCQLCYGAENYLLLQAASLVSAFTFQLWFQFMMNSDLVPLNIDKFVT